MHHRHHPSSLDTPDNASSTSSILGQRSRSPAQRKVLQADAARVQISRDLRRKHFEAHIFSEPAWDMLLALYVIDNDRRRLRTTQLSEITNLSLSTALRWMDYLEEQDLIRRRPSPVDRRVVEIELSDKGRAAMDNYFTHAREAAVFGIFDDR